MSEATISLKDKVAIVTGGRRGLGKAIAMALARAGAHVAVCDRVTKDGEIDQVVAEIQKIGSRALAVEADISKITDIDGMVQKVIAEFNTIDILVNNAAMNIRSPLVDLREDGWDKVINTDLKGYFLCSQAAGREMIKKKTGNIINIASTAAFKAEKQMGAYCIAKAGVVVLARVLAIELAEHNIRVNSIAPYMIKTTFSQPLWSAPDVMQNIEGTIPLGRLAEVGDITGTVLFLASDLAGYITGQTITVDGGLSS